MEQQDIPRVCLPALNAPAPDFEAQSTHGPIRLSQFRGKWVMLFSHPADFTPV
jgi:peroxiredoxin (alkyl hydroperoxide reductase subunit C)